MSPTVDAGADRDGELRRYWPAVLAGVLCHGRLCVGIRIQRHLRVFGGIAPAPWLVSGLIGAAITTYYIGGAACMVLIDSALRWLGPGRLLAAGCSARGPRCSAKASTRGNCLEPRP
jgi:hypothetical protein